LAIVYQVGAEEEASVVQAYLPGVPVVESSKLNGAPVAVLVNASYQAKPPKPDQAAEACPAA
jgi:hypothetical protein